MDHDNQPEQQPPRNVYRDDPEYRRRLLEQKKREYQDPEHRERLLGAMRARYWQNPEQSRRRWRERRQARLAGMPEEERKEFEDVERDKRRGTERDRSRRERLAASAVYKQYRGLEPGWPEVPPPGLTVALHPGSARKKRSVRTPAAVLVRPYARQMEPPEDRLAALVPSVLADATLDLDDSEVKRVITARTNETGLDATKALDEAKAWQDELGKAMFGSGIPGPPQLFGHLDAGLDSAQEAAPGMFGAPYAGEVHDQVFDTGQWPPVPPVMNPFESSAYGHLPGVGEGTPSSWDDAMSQAMDKLTITAPVPPTAVSAHDALPPGHQQVAHGQGTPWPPGRQLPGSAGPFNPQTPYAYGPAGPSGSGGPTVGYVVPGQQQFPGGAGSYSPPAPHTHEPAPSPRYHSQTAYVAPGQQLHGGFGSARPASPGGPAK